MLAHEAQALAAIRAVYAEPIIYTGAGLDGATIAAIPTDIDQRGANGGRRTTFCIAAELLPEEPDVDNQIVHSGTDWRAIDVDYAADVNEWQVAVERGIAPR